MVSSKPTMLGRASAAFRPGSGLNYGLLIITLLYFCVLSYLSGARPFWVDELLQLFGTRDLSGNALLYYVMGFPGAAPLGYLIQHWSIGLFGFSAWSSRLPSEVSSVLGCVGMFLVFQRLAHTSWWLSTLCWMLLPLQLRYAVEGRPYALGLLFSILGSLFFFQLLSNPSILNGITYCIAVLLGIYCAPYTVFLQLGYLAGVVIFQNDRFQKVLVAAALAISTCAFLPWYVASLNHWRNSIAVTADMAFKVTPKFVLLPLQEIAGGGYICSIPLLILAAVGYRSPHLKMPVKGCLLLGIVFGVFCVLGADLFFGYFFAIRQVMFVLVPLFVLATIGAASLVEHKHRIVAAILVLMFISGSIIKDVRYFLDRSEDWGAASMLLQAATKQGACLNFVSSDNPQFYTFYEPSIVSSTCSTRALRQTLVAVPFTRYTQPDELRKTQDYLLNSGFYLGSSASAGGTTVSIYKLHQ